GREQADDNGMRPCSFLALLLALTVSSPSLSRAAEESEGSAPVAWATLQLESGHATTLRIMARSGDRALARALENISGRAPRSTQYGGWTQWTVELPVPDRQGLVLHQELDLAPLLEALAGEGAPRLALQIQYPAAGFSHLTGARPVTIRRGTLAAT